MCAVCVRAVCGVINYGSETQPKKWTREKVHSNNNGEGRKLAAPIAIQGNYTSLFSLTIVLLFAKNIYEQ